MIRAVYTSGETEGHLNFHPGDRIGFRNPQTLADEGEGEIVQAELLDNKTMRLRIKGKLPKQSAGFWVENRTWIPDEVIIRNNYFGRGPTRSILIYLARRAVIENNRFHRIRMASILLQTPDQRYALQNSVGSLAVRNNVFFECTGPLIQSNPQVKTLSPTANLYGTLLVENNLLSMRENKPLFLNLRGFRDVKIAENQIETTGADANLARITDCQSVHLLPQRLLGIQGKPQVEFIRVKQHASNNWTIK